MAQNPFSEIPPINGGERTLHGHLATGLLRCARNDDSPDTSPASPAFTHSQASFPSRPASLPASTPSPACSPGRLASFPAFTRSRLRCARNDYFTADSPASLAFTHLQACSPGRLASFPDSAPSPPECVAVLAMTPSRTIRQLPRPSLLAFTLSPTFPPSPARNDFTDDSPASPPSLTHKPAPPAAPPAPPPSLTHKPAPPDASPASPPSPARNDSPDDPTAPLPSPARHWIASLRSQ
jgi:hypothetical protein